MQATYVAAGARACADRPAVAGAAAARADVKTAPRARTLELEVNPMAVRPWSTFAADL
jgi:hypothetical protein